MECERGIDPISTSLDQPIEFLTEIFASGVGYSSVGTARSALSSVLIMNNGISFGKHNLVQRFMKDIFNLRPTLPRQFAVWDPDIVLISPLLCSQNTLQIGKFAL